MTRPRRVAALGLALALVLLPGGHAAELPAARLRALPAGPAVRVSPQLPSPVSVLLIEDNADTLERDEALALFERERPTVIVSDISMPGGDGYSFIREVRARDDGRTPAVAMTGLARKDDRAAALKAGFDEHVSKPIDPDARVRSVRALALARGADVG